MIMAAGGQYAQTTMQINQRLRNELLFRHVHFYGLVAVYRGTW